VASLHREGCELPNFKRRTKSSVHPVSIVSHLIQPLSALVINWCVTHQQPANFVGGSRPSMYCSGKTHQYDAPGIALVLYALQFFRSSAKIKRLTQYKSIS
jgi:hypothetical protein